MAKHAWPKDLADQAGRVRGVLNATGVVLTPTDVAAFFTGARTTQIVKVLDTLVALGHARRTEGGYIAS